MLATPVLALEMAGVTAQNEEMVEHQARGETKRGRLRAARTAAAVMTLRIIMIAMQTTNAPNRRSRIPRRADDQGAATVTAEVTAMATMTMTNSGNDCPKGLAAYVVQLCSTGPLTVPSSLAEKQTVPKFGAVESFRDDWAEARREVVSKSGRKQFCGP